MGMLLFAECTLCTAQSVTFVCNEVHVVKLSVPNIILCDFYTVRAKIWSKLLPHVCVVNRHTCGRYRNTFLHRKHPKITGSLKREHCSIVARPFMHVHMQAKV